MDECNATGCTLDCGQAKYGRTGYEAYGGSTGGLTFDGRPMPKWRDLPARVQKAWVDAARAIRSVP